MSTKFAPPPPISRLQSLANKTASAFASNASNSRRNPTNKRRFKQLVHSALINSRVPSDNIEAENHPKKRWSVEIIIGPVIGKVTDTSARILVECSGPSQLKCVLTELPIDSAVGAKIPGHDAWHWHPEHGARSKGYPVHISTAPLRERMPFVFFFRGLQPSRRYAVAFEGCKNCHLHMGSFKTLPDCVHHLKAMSINRCNRAGLRTPAARIAEEPYLEEIVRRINSNELDLLLHHGGQVLGDLALQQARRLVNQSESTEAELIKAISEVYAKQYRASWNRPRMQHILANVSNLMVWGKQDIFSHTSSPIWRDKLGRGSSSNDFLIAVAARRAYWLYQRQLWDAQFDAVIIGKASEEPFPSFPPTNTAAAAAAASAAVQDPSKRNDGHKRRRASSGDSITTTPEPITTECHWHIMPGSKIAVMLLDTAGGQLFYTSAESPLLSESQWALLRGLFSEDGELSQVQTLLVASALPLAVVGRNPCVCVCRSNGQSRNRRGHTVAAVATLIPSNRAGFSMAPQEQHNLLDMLMLWKYMPSRVAAREVLYVGGGEGNAVGEGLMARLWGALWGSAGLLGSVYDQAHTGYERAHINQVVASASPASAWSCLSVPLMRCFLACARRLATQRFIVEHTTYQRQPNAGVISLVVNPKTMEGSSDTFLVDRKQSSINNV